MARSLLVGIVVHCREADFSVPKLIMLHDNIKRARLLKSIMPAFQEAQDHILAKVIAHVNNNDRHLHYLQVMRELAEYKQQLLVKITKIEFDADPTNNDIGLLKFYIVRQINQISYEP